MATSPDSDQASAVERRHVDAGWDIPEARPETRTETPATHLPEPDAPTEPLQLRLRRTWAHQRPSYLKDYVTDL